MRSFYEPTKEQLLKLESSPWICSYSGGKDSTSLVTWMEWLRKTGWITCKQPRLVMSDTEVEYGFLQNISYQMIRKLRDCGWICDVVKPRRKDKLYCSIFGRGVPPTSPKVRGMRWCSRATKVDPMKRYKNEIDTSLLMLTGMRWGESKIRDEKLLASGCRAGGECGLPAPNVKNRVWSPIIEWTDCQVFDWLQGNIVKSQRCVIADLLPYMRQLVDVYNVKQGPVTLDDSIFRRDLKMQRFGCVGCPAVSVNSSLRNVRENNPELSPYIRAIYRIWEEIWSPENRVVPKPGKRMSAITIEARKRLFEKLLVIQRESGLKLVTEKDEEFIRKCWEDKVYPRGWSEADERK